MDRDQALIEAAAEYGEGYGLVLFELSILSDSLDDHALKILCGNAVVLSKKKKSGPTSNLS